MLHLYFWTVALVSLVGLFACLFGCLNGCYLVCFRFVVSMRCAYRSLLVSSHSLPLRRCWRRSRSGICTIRHTRTSPRCHRRSQWPRDWFARQAGHRSRTCGSISSAREPTSLTLLHARTQFAETPEEKRKRARTSVFMPGVGPVRSVMSPSQDLRFNPWLRPPVVPAAPTTAAAAAAAASQAAMAQGMLAYQMPFPTTPYQSPFALAPLAAPTPAMLPTAVPGTQSPLTMSLFRLASPPAAFRFSLRIVMNGKLSPFYEW